MLLLIVIGCGGGVSSNPGGETGGTATGNTATVTWTSPSTNADGTTLTDLAGYKIYYGRRFGSYTTQATIFINVTTLSSTTSSNIVFSNLSSGTYCFAVTAYDTSGNESEYSNVVSKTMGSGSIGNCQ